MSKRTKGASVYAVRAVERVMSDGKERDFGEIVEAIHDLPLLPKRSSAKKYQVPTRGELNHISKKLGLTVTRQTRHYDGVVDGKRVILSRQRTVYRK